MKTDDKIRNETLQCDINRGIAKTSTLPSSKNEEYGFLTDKEMLLADQNRLAEVYLIPFINDFEKKIQTIKNKGEKQMKAIEEHGKQLVKSSDEVYLSKLLKPEEIFEKLVEERQDEIQNLSKQINYNDLRYYFTTKESSPK